MLLDCLTVCLSVCRRCRWCWRCHRRRRRCCCGTQEQRTSNRALPACSRSGYRAPLRTRSIQSFPSLRQHRRTHLNHSPPLLPRFLPPGPRPMPPNKRGPAGATRSRTGSSFLAPVSSSQGMDSAATRCRRKMFRSVRNSSCQRCPCCPPPTWSLPRSGTCCCDSVTTRTSPTTGTWFGRIDRRGR